MITLNSHDTKIWKEGSSYFYPFTNYTPLTHKFNACALVDYLIKQYTRIPSHHVAF